MNPAHVHLALNHIPVIGSLILVLALAYAWARKSEDVRIWSFYLAIFVALLAIPVYFSGEAAEEAIEHLAGVGETWIEAHEESALLALISSELTGFAALLALVLSRKRPEELRWYFGSVLALALVSLLLMARTASLGGPIRHEELRSGPAASAPAEDHD